MLIDNVVYIMSCITCFALGMNISTLIRYNRIIKEAEYGRKDDGNNQLSAQAEKEAKREYAGEYHKAENPEDNHENDMGRATEYRPCRCPWCAWEDEGTTSHAIGSVSGEGLQ